MNTKIRTLYEVAELIAGGKIAVAALMEEFLGRIAATDDELNAYSQIFNESALREARVVDREIADGNYKGPLHGIPIAIKDIYDIAGYPTTASSRQRSSWMPSGTARAVQLLVDAGAIVVGKTHTHEFALGIRTPKTSNPWDVDRIPGGSSGGSAVAIAAGTALLATGTDTAGSIRIPASICGISGFKPSYGRVSRSGVAPLSWSLDHSGPMARSVKDIIISMDVLDDFDISDVAAWPRDKVNYSDALTLDLSSLTIGVPLNFFYTYVEDETVQAVFKAIENFAKLGANIKFVKIPHEELFVPAGYVICLAEAANYHSRMLQHSPELYGADVLESLTIGAGIKTHDYIQAQKGRRLIQKSFDRIFQDVDVLLTPSVANPAVPKDQFEICWSAAEHESVQLAYTRLAVPANIAGVPALSVPCGLTSSGLPIGLQIMGGFGKDLEVLAAGWAYESENDWVRKAPPGYFDESQ